ncbi:MAG: hypothetical protein ACREB7_09370 [Sphingopyxis sp.]|uniref:hypothetical protein n=1 Tax=Sphingopyxis sp. TaxID=1908224 RepID=UPI003D6D6675
MALLHDLQGSENLLRSDLVAERIDRHLAIVGHANVKQDLVVVRQGFQPKAIEIYVGCPAIIDWPVRRNGDAPIDSMQAYDRAIGLKQRLRRSR